MVSRSAATVWLPALGANHQKSKASRSSAAAPRAILVRCDRPVEATTLSMPVPLSARGGPSEDLILITLIPTSCRSISNHRATDAAAAQAVPCQSAAGGRPNPDTSLYGGGQDHSRMLAQPMARWALPSSQAPAARLARPARLGGSIAGTGCIRDPPQ